MIWLLNTSLNLKEIPQAPGVYLFKSKKGEILYIGKAKDLRARLSTYVKAPPLSPKLEVLLEKTDSVEYFLTENEKSALLLEANLIKKYRPKYNVLLKDDKNYPLLRIPIKEKYPSLQIVRRRKKGDSALYFGPFTSAKGLREILKLLSKTFPLRKCSLAEMKRRKTPCVYYQIKKCLAPCVYSIPENEYKKLVDGVIEFFQGKGNELIKKLENEMHRLSENLEFERAAFLRDRIEDLKRVLEAQAVVLNEPLDLDLWEFKKENSYEYFIVLFVRYGYLYGFQTFKIKNPLEETSSLKDVILQFYMDGKFIPERIFLPSEIEEKEELESIFSEFTGNKIQILTQTETSEIAILKELALKNLENFIISEKRREKPWYSGLSEELTEVLRLSQVPRWIEAIDLSQFYGSARVGAIVCYFEGNPEKSRYRHYHIKSEAKDDYAMLYEVIYRRLKRGLEENNLPDLFLIDGGKGHLETALRAAEDLEIKEVEFRAVAKNEKRQPEKLFIPGRKNPIFLPKYKEVYHFIGRIMDNAHNFAKTFAEKTKEKETLGSLLEKIKGIGPKRKEVLLKNFKNLEEIIKAPPEKLALLPGFNLRIAKTIKEKIQIYIQK